MKYFLTLLATLIISSDLRAETIYPTTTAEYASTVVMIMNKPLTGGGTGVIWHSTKERSYILTNAHVCHVASHGGYVLKNNAMYDVIAFKVSTQHDLCLLYVNSDLGIDTKVSASPPEMWSKATIAGHPHLSPETVVVGHFSRTHTITIQIGSRPCTEAELKKNPIVCLFAGAPIVKQFEAQFTTATILPGSSGSPVFNEDGEIAGLVFASDSRELAYAEIVPQYYVKNFVVNELRKLKWTLPSPQQEADMSDDAKNHKRIYFQPLYFPGK